ncbi:MAG TPA: ATP-binding protein [Ktedonobacterales bacterium]|nr:ATP-binding protein [Ktedonobacterales bacterium]
MKLAEIREHAREVNAAREAERAERERVERAAFTGSCFPCRDTGYARGGLGLCDCPRGVALAEEQRRAALRSLLDAANLPLRYAAYTLDSYPDQRIHALGHLRAFLASWDGHQSLLLGGRYGTGKTGLLVGALKDVAARYVAGGVAGRPIHFTTAADLLERLRRGYSDHSNDETLEYVCRVRLLAVDDLGAEKHTDWVLDRLFVIFNTRYNACLPTFVTTNYGLPQLAGRVGERVAERLIESSRGIAVEGENLRRRNMGNLGGSLS